MEPLSSGTADGTFTFPPVTGAEHLLATRASGPERSTADFATLIGRLRFDNNPGKSGRRRKSCRWRAPSAQALVYTISPSTARFDARHLQISCRPFP